MSFADALLPAPQLSDPIGMGLSEASTEHNATPAIVILYAPQPDDHIGMGLVEASIEHQDERPR